MEEEMKEYYHKQIKDEFYKHYKEFYTTDDEFDAFKEKYVENAYKGVKRDYIENYEDLLYMLKIIKEYEDTYVREFNDWNDPEKIFSLGTTILAKNIIADIKQKDIPTLSKSQVQSIIKYIEKEEGKELNQFYWEVVFPVNCDKEALARAEEEKIEEKKMEEIKKEMYNEMLKAAEHNEKSIMYEKLMMEERKKMAYNYNDGKTKFFEYQLKKNEEQKKMEEHNGNMLKHKAKLDELIELLHKKYGSI